MEKIVLIYDNTLKFHIDHLRDDTFLMAYRVQSIFTFTCFCFAGHASRVNASSVPVDLHADCGRRNRVSDFPHCQIACHSVDDGWNGERSRRVADAGGLLSMLATRFHLTSRFASIFLRKKQKKFLSFILHYGHLHA